MITATRYHDISCGHRVVGHEGKCALLHGHNYRIHFAYTLDEIDSVIDFSEIVSTLCEWLENNWANRFLCWVHDDEIRNLRNYYRSELDKEYWLLRNSIVWVSFNPTAQNMAKFLVEEIGPEILPKGVRLVKCKIDESRKFSATYRLGELKGNN